MENIIERAIVPRNPSPVSLLNKEQYSLYAPIARPGQAGIAEFDTDHFTITRQIVRINTDNIATVSLVAETVAEVKSYADNVAQIAEDNAKAYADIVAQAAENNAKEYADTITSGVLGSASSDKHDMTVHSNRKLIEENAARIADLYSPDALADLVITTEEDFDRCLYPLYKDEEALTREQAASIVNDDSAFNTPDPNFKAKRIIVKDVTFTKVRGYDDIRLHIFQPSIEYIRFDNCRWETHWKVSGKNPRDTNAMNCNLNTAPERATSFNRATDILTLTIEGLHITEDNVSAARISDQWGVGLRNIKALKNCYIDYPKNYRLEPEGYAALEMSCQFFDFADNCEISGLWDGTNVVNCKVSKILKRCSNVVNLNAVNLFNQNGNIVPLKVLSCVDMVNIKGTVTFTDANTPSCEHEVAATREEAQAYADTAEQNAIKVADSKVPKGTPAWGTYHEGLMLYGQSYDGSISFEHATTRSGGNEVAIRDAKGRLGNSWQDLPSEYVDSNGWGKGVCMPRHYIDALVKGGNFKKYQNGVLVGEETTYGYAPLNNKYKIDATYLPSYVDDVIEGYLHVVEGKQHFSESVDPQITDAWYTPEDGKIYVDLSTNKTYRWSGSKYVEISQSLALGTTSSTACPGDKGETAYEHSQSTGNPHATTAADVGAVALQKAPDGQRYIYATGWGNSNTTPLLLDTGSGADGKIPSYWAPDAATSLPDNMLITGNPTKDEHAANKKYADGKVPRLSHTAEGDDYRVYAQNNKGGTEEFLWASQTATHAGDERGSLAWRYPGGQLDVASPSSPYHAANKEYVDSVSAAIPDDLMQRRFAVRVYTKNGDSVQASTKYIAASADDYSNDTAPLRTYTGQLRVPYVPVSDSDATSKKYVDGLAHLTEFALGVGDWGVSKQILRSECRLCGLLRIISSNSIVSWNTVDLIIMPNEGVKCISTPVPSYKKDGTYNGEIMITATVESVSDLTMTVKFGIDFRVGDTVTAAQGDQLDFNQFRGCLKPTVVFGF